MVKNYYRALGLDRSASEEDMKRAYRNLALRYHPDKNKSPDAEAKFKEINEAYGALIEKKREVFYSSGGEGYQSSGSSTDYRPEAFNFSQHFDSDHQRGFDELLNCSRRSDAPSLFQQSFCAGGTLQQAYGPGRIFEQTFGPGGTFEQTFSPGGTSEQMFSPGQKCQLPFDFNCGYFQSSFRFGNGFGTFFRSDTFSHGGPSTSSRAHTTAPSSEYGASGSSQDANPRYSERSSTAGNSSQRGPEVSFVQREIFVTLEEVFNGCCKKVKIELNVAAADGRSVTRYKKVIRIHMIPGVPSGAKLTFQCPGERTSTHSPPTIAFFVRDKEHALFKRKGADIQYVAKLTPWQAQWSTRIDVPTLTLGNISLPLAGPVRSGSIKRVECQGLSYHRDKTKRGDLLVIFQVCSGSS